MIGCRCLVLLPFLLAACDGAPDGGNANLTSLPEEDHVLISSGATAKDVTAARAYLAPFTTADPDACFGEVDLVDARMEGRRGTAFAASADTKRVVIAMDGSGSMAARIGGRSKLDLAKESTLAFIDGLGPEVDAALLVFGQQGSNAVADKARSCAAVDQLAPMSRDRAKLIAAVRQVRPVGWTPLTAALRRAQAQLGTGGVPGEQIVYVVSDGNETCGGDPVAAARTINTGPTRAIVNIIGFDLPAADRAALQAVATAGGGTLINIASDEAYRKTIATIRESGRRNRNAIAGSAARTKNIIDSGAAITRATLCTGGIITRETLRVGADLTRRDAAKTPGPARRLVFAILNQRHKAMTTRRDAYQARLKGSRDASVDAIKEKEKRAE